MVGLWLSPEAAATLAIPGYEPADSLHITLLCLEKDADALTDVQVAHLLACVDNIAAFWAPLSGEISGKGRLYAKDDAPNDAFVAFPDIVELSRLRERIAEEIGWEGLRASDEHGFQPHITLAYIPPGADDPANAVPTIPLVFDALTVCVGDRQTEIPFRGYPGDDGLYYTAATAIGGDGLFFNEARFTTPPTWLPFLPKPGEYIHPKYGTVDLSPDVIAEYVAGVNGGVFQKSIPIDISHDAVDLHLNGALGWFGEARVNADGSADIKVDQWTDRGINEIEADHFRYVSPVLHNTWQDDQGNDHKYVATGLALCVSPFFKELSIDRVIVASDRSASTPTLSFVRQTGEPMRFVGTEQGAVFAPEVQRMDTTVVDPNAVTDVEDNDRPNLPEYDDWLKLQPPGGDSSATAYAKWLLGYCQKMDAGGTPVKAPEADPATPPPVTATDPRSELGMQFADLSRRYEATETELKAERAARRKKEFTDEVRGRSDANNIQWFGDVEKHVRVLESFTDPTTRQDYIDQQRETAKRMTALIGKEIGSDANGATGSALEQINAKADALVAANAGLTRAQAFTQVCESDRQLFAAYQSERKGY